MKHIKNNKLTSYKKYLVEIPEDKVNLVNKQLVWDLFDNELDIQVRVTGIIGDTELIELPNEVEMKYLYPPEITNDEDAEFHEGM